MPIGADMPLVEHQLAVQWEDRFLVGFLHKLPALHASAAPPFSLKMLLKFAVNKFDFFTVGWSVGLVRSDNLVCFVNQKCQFWGATQLGMTFELPKVGNGRNKPVTKS